MSITIGTLGNTISTDILYSICNADYEIERQEAQ